MESKVVVEEVVADYYVKLSAEEARNLVRAARMAAPLMMAQHPEGFWLATGWSSGAETLDSFADAIDEDLKDKEED